MLTGKVIEPPTGIAAAGVVQVNGGPNTQPQPGGKGATSVAAAGNVSSKVTGPKYGDGPSLMISIS